MDREIRKVIITGPTGAIGVALADLLTSRGKEVYAICRPKSPNILNLKKHERLHVIECDISKLLTLEKVLDKGFDAFYHFAWNGTIGDARNNIDLQLDNIKHTLDATDLARRLDCKVFIGAGSQAEYGHFNKPADENTSTNPFTLYGAAKLSAGKMSRIYANNIGLSHIWTRIFSVYGPNDDSKTLISYVINELKCGRVPQLTKGEQVWDYLYSYDAAIAMLKVAEKGKNNSTYCIGSGQQRLLKDYIKDIASLFCIDIEEGLGKKPYSENQTMFLSANINKLKKDTGFSPQYEFKSSIASLIGL